MAGTEPPKKSQVIGIGFYNGLDLGRALRGGSLKFAIGSTDLTTEEKQRPQVGIIVCEELDRLGFQRRNHHVRWSLLSANNNS